MIEVARPICDHVDNAIVQGWIVKRTVSLFVPCFVDQLLPQVAVDTVKVLRRIGYGVDYPEDQTCCGQPAFNTGYWNEARPCAEHFVRVFKHADVIVCPSGSCTTMVRTFIRTCWLRAHCVRTRSPWLSRTFELSEFLVKVAAVTRWAPVFRTRLPTMRPAMGSANFTFTMNRCNFCVR